MNLYGIMSCINKHSIKATIFVVLLYTIISLIVTYNLYKIHKEIHNEINLLHSNYNHNIDLAVQVIPLLNTKKSQYQSPIANSDIMTLKYWMFSLKNDSDIDFMYAKIAVKSAITNTNLTPILLIDGRSKEIEDWMELHNVVVIDMSSHKDLELIRNCQYLTDSIVGMAGWNRVIIPDAMKVYIYYKLSDMQLSYEDNFILYTDVDVIFQRDIMIPKSLLPKYISFAKQGNIWSCYNNILDHRNYINSGVMIMNIEEYQLIQPQVINYIINPVIDNRNQLKFKSFDKSALKSFFPCYSNVDSQTLSQHNIQYYSSSIPRILEFARDLNNIHEAMILHWHGPKILYNNCDEYFDNTKKTTNKNPYIVLNSISEKDSITNSDLNSKCGDYLLFITNRTLIASYHKYITEICENEYYLRR